MRNSCNKVIDVHTSAKKIVYLCADGGIRTQDEINKKAGNHKFTYSKNLTLHASRRKKSLPL